ncbi:hypothetical protein CLIB1444_13S02982 [[Candida] jaroonii]|uniref:Uncharacterized protein n=1 Tax=[Candida] jaroonii TaxID=467808 RepID=A0ACA9YET7_9ASCO|nr:hypothetical protein CLIB1444_13S02982 [[Candida] jaroonii]
MSKDNISQDVENWISDTGEVKNFDESKGITNSAVLTNNENEDKSQRDEDDRSRSRISKEDLMDNFIPLPPKSPVMSSSDSLLNITPYTSSHNDNDDYVIYSDSEIGSQNSLELTTRSKLSMYSGSREESPSRDNSPSRAKAKRRTSKTKRGNLSPRRDSGEREKDSSTPKSKVKRKIRRKSTKSDGSERSHPYIGSGYTSTPATGKVFRNLLILEESLRQQVFQQKALRRKYLTFMAILCSLIASISHYLYVADTNQSSKSTVRVILTFVLLALMFTLLLYYLSGEYQKTIVLPRRFLSSTNKGLRQLNIRLVKIKIPWVDYFSDLLRELLLNFTNSCLNLLHKMDPNSYQNKNSKLEVLLISLMSQCQPRTGIADVKLVLNARVFNTDIREGWELYRSEFWLEEGMRRRNNLLNFITGHTEDDSSKEKLKREKREGKRKRSSTNTNVNTTPVLGILNEENLEQLADKLNNEISIPK